MKILFSTSELAPWVKTGGLGDVAGALPAALRALGHDVRVLVPAYPALLQAFPGAAEIARPHWLGGLLPTPGLREATAPDGTPLLLLDYRPYFDRTGNPYLGPEGRDWLDNHLRFGLLSRVAAWIGSEASTLDWQPDVIHCNDWQSGAGAGLSRLRRRAPGEVAGHGAQPGLPGHLRPRRAVRTGPARCGLEHDGVEYHGYLSFLKAGLQHADAINTVSPSYAREIQTDAEGMGMAGLLRHRAADSSPASSTASTRDWNPAHDGHLAHATARAGWRTRPRTRPRCRPRWASTYAPTCRCWRWSAALPNRRGSTCSLKSPPRP
jgi:starch synthase